MGWDNIKIRYHGKDYLPLTKDWEMVDFVERVRNEFPKMTIDKVRAVAYSCNEEVGAPYETKDIIACVQRKLE